MMSGEIEVCSMEYRAGFVLRQILPAGGGLRGTNKSVIAVGLLARTDGRQFLEVCPGGVVKPHRRVPQGDFFDGFGQMQNGAGAHGPRTVAGGSVGHQARSIRQLLAGLDQRVADPGRWFERRFPIRR